MTEAEVEAPALKDFKDILPSTFLEEKGGKYMLSILSQRPLWRERPVEKGKPDKILFLNLQSDRNYTFDGSTLQTTELDDILNHGDGFNGVVVVTGSMSDGDPNVVRNLTAGISSLKPGGSVFLFEKPYGKLEKPKDFVEREWREKTLKEIGLVEVNVLNSGRTVPCSILWEAHVPREGGLKHPIDLLENGPYYIDGMIGEMKRSYEEEGWTVVDINNSELYKKLKNSKFPLKDIHAIRDRFGVRIKSTFCPTATCEGVVPIDTGSLEMINTCGENHSHTKHPKEISSKSEEKAEKVVDKDYRPYCGEGHGKMITSKLGGYWCPKCGGK